MSHAHKTGVLWSGDSVYEGIPETLKMLQAKGKCTHTGEADIYMYQWELTFPQARGPSL